jgi:hypothetical protein
MVNDPRDPRPPGPLRLIEEPSRLEPPDFDRILRAARRARKARFLRALKLTCGCIDCGYRDDASRLSFDHRPGTVKGFNVSRGTKRTWRQSLAEIEKCEIRCLVCHADRHSDGNTQRPRMAKSKNELACNHEAEPCGFPHNVCKTLHGFTRSEHISCPNH